MEIKTTGEIGEINPIVLTNFKLEFPVAALELNLQKFLSSPNPKTFPTPTKCHKKRKINKKPKKKKGCI